MKLEENPQLPAQPDTAYLQDLVYQVQQMLSKQNQQINAVSEGRISAATNASDVPPSDGTGTPGDFVAKRNPVAQGPAGAQYVLVGWRCVSTGSSTRWLEVIENVRVPPAAPSPTPAPTSAPSPSPATPYSQKIQAENATLHGITAVTTIAGYEGTGHADWFRSGYDEYLEFSFTSSPTASGNLTLRYANYGDQTLTVLLNGATTGTMYTFTNSGGTWTTKVISGVSFVSGTNTVRLTPEYSGYTYIDYAQFDQTTGAPPPPPPPSSPTPPPPPPPAPAPAPGSAPYYPFGSRLDGTYPYGIKVSGVSNATMDAAVKDCYDKWKLARLAKSPTFTPSAGIYAGQQITDGYHVQWGTSDEATRSEGMGYGMLITVLMAGYDANAKTYFDGMYKVVRGCPAVGMTSQLGTGVTNYLMDYRILPNISSGDGWPALDGDMDITLALLMAHRQWGSSGAINYFQDAQNACAAMKAAHFTNEVIVARNVSRVSDYMAGHFRSFKTATNDVFWDNVRTKALTLAQNITTNYSPTAKLQPGFIYDPFGNPRPDTVVHLDRSGIEQICDQNSVRNEWRWATDYVFSGDTGWGNLAKGIVTWLQSSSGGSASAFSYAYNLDGSPVTSGLYHEGTTSGCCMAGCMVDVGFQTFLNTLYAGNIGSGFKTNYYESELMLLPLILVTGNWWRP